MNEREQAIQEIEIYGFTLLESVLDSDTAAAMRQALIRCEQEHGTEHTHRGAGPPRGQPSGHGSHLPSVH